MASDDVLERAEAYREQFADRSDAMPLIRDLAAEVRALRKDRERLDWLDAQIDPSWPLFDSASWKSAPDLREAIDSAMAKESSE